MPNTSYPCSSRSSARSEPSWPPMPVMSARRVTPAMIRAWTERSPTRCAPASGPAGEAEFWGSPGRRSSSSSGSRGAGHGALEGPGRGAHVVFAAAGAEHEAVMRPAEEEARIAPAAPRGDSTARARFHHRPVARRAARGVAPGLDLVLSTAPTASLPDLDWWFLARELRVGGRMLLDDAYLPRRSHRSSTTRGRATRGRWSPVSFRTACIRKLGEDHRRRATPTHAPPRERSASPTCRRRGGWWRRPGHASSPPARASGSCGSSVRRSRLVSPACAGTASPRPDRAGG